MSVPFTKACLIRELEIYSTKKEESIYYRHVEK